MTQYFLTMPHDSATEPTMESMQAFDPAELAAVMAAVDEFNTALKDSGAWLFAGGLNPPSTAKDRRRHIGRDARARRAVRRGAVVRRRILGDRGGRRGRSRRMGDQGVGRGAVPHRGARAAGTARGVAAQAADHPARPAR